MKAEGLSYIPTISDGIYGIEIQCELEKSLVILSKLD